MHRLATVHARDNQPTNDQRRHDTAYLNKVRRLKIIVFVTLNVCSRSFKVIDIKWKNKRTFSLIQYIHCVYSQLGTGQRLTAVYAWEHFWITWSIARFLCESKAIGLLNFQFMWIWPFRRVDSAVFVFCAKFGSNICYNYWDRRTYVSYYYYSAPL